MVARGAGAIARPPGRSLSNSLCAGAQGVRLKLFKSGIFGDKASSGLYGAFSRGQVFLTGAAAAILLEAPDFAAFFLCVNTASTIASVSGSGIGVAVNTMLSGGRWRETSRPLVVGAMLAVAVTLILVSGMLAYAMSVGGGAKASLWNGVFPLLSLALVVAALTEGALYGRAEYRALLRNAVLASIALAILVIPILILSGWRQALAAYAVYRCVWVGANVWMLFKLDWRTVDEPIGPKDFWAVLRLGFPISCAAIFAGPLITLAMWWIEYYYGLDAVARFGWFYQIFVLFSFLPAALTQYFISQASRGREKAAGSADGNRLRTNVSLASVSIVIILVCHALVSADTRLLGVLDSGPLAVAAILALLFQSLNASFYAHWAGIEKPWEHFWGQAVGGASFVFCFAAFSKLDGVFAAAWSLASLQAGVLLFNLYRAKRQDVFRG